MIHESPSGDGIPTGFHEVALAAYANDPNWPGESKEQLERAFHLRNPWFERGVAHTFCDPKEARVAVFLQSQAAFFGYFEAAGDPRPLMARAEAWAKAQGVDMLYGPIDFTTYGRYRLRTTPSLEPPFSGEPYNRSAYPEMLESMGYEVEQRYLTQIVSMQTYGKVVDMLARTAGEYRVETLTKQTWMSRLDELHALADSIYASNFAYTPLTRTEFEAQCGEAYIDRVCLQSSVIAFDADDRIAGFFLTYPHPKIPRAVVNKTTGVRPQDRRRGLMDAMAVAMFERQRDLYDRVYAALIRDDNPSRNLGRKASCEERWYALYRKKL